MNEGLWEGWAKEGSRDEARRLEVTGWWDARPIQPFEVVYPRRRREIARDSVTSSGRQPSWSVIVGSAPDFSSRSTISTNSHAEATKTKQSHIVTSETERTTWNVGYFKYFVSREQMHRTPIIYPISGEYPWVFIPMRFSCVFSERSQLLDGLPRWALQKLESSYEWMNKLNTLTTRR